MARVEPAMASISIPRRRAASKKQSSGGKPRWQEQQQQQEEKWTKRKDTQAESDVQEPKKADENPQGKEWWPEENWTTIIVHNPGGVRNEK